MTDTYDNVYNSAIVKPSREVVYDYPTSVVNGEGEIAARRVEMTANPSYEISTCSKKHVSSKQ